MDVELQAFSFKIIVAFRYFSKMWNILSFLRNFSELFSTDNINEIVNWLAPGIKWKYQQLSYRDIGTVDNFSHTRNHWNNPDRTAGCTLWEIIQNSGLWKLTISLFLSWRDLLQFGTSFFRVFYALNLPFSELAMSNTGISIRTSVSIIAICCLSPPPSIIRR